MFAFCRIPTPSVELLNSTSTSVQIKFPKTLSNFFFEHFPFLTPKFLLQSKRVSNIFEKKFQQNFGQVKVSNFDNGNGGSHGGNDNFVWTVDNLTPYSLFTFRISIVLSENFPEVSAIVTTDATDPVRTGLSSSSSSSPVLEAVQQVRN